MGCSGNPTPRPRAAVKRRRRMHAESVRVRCKSPPRGEDIIPKSGAEGPPQGSPDRRADNGPCYVAHAPDRGKDHAEQQEAAAPNDTGPTESRKRDHLVPSVPPPSLSVARRVQIRWASLDCDARCTCRSIYIGCVSIGAHRSHRLPRLGEGPFVAAAGHNRCPCIVGFVSSGPHSSPRPPRLGKGRLVAAAGHIQRPYIVFWL